MMQTFPLRQLAPMVDRCVAFNIPFAVFAFPGDADYHLLSSLPDPLSGTNRFDDSRPETDRFTVGFFNNEETYDIAISGSGDGSPTVPFVERPLPPAEIEPLTKSTPQALYLAQVHELKKLIHGSKEKIVLSRIIAGRTSRRLMDVAEDYFARFPGTLRFIYFTQETGLWLGATPELLFEADLKTGKFHAMALAGTRPYIPDNQEVWDEKNDREQYIVAKAVMGSLYGMNLFDCDCTYRNLRFGDIEHICTDFNGTGFSLEDNPHPIQELSPTPAVCGYPYEKAISLIYEYEIHSRYCYSGAFTVYDGAARSLRSFVNLRCAFLKPEGDTLLYNIYTGSGLTSRSIAKTEWLETEAKAAALLKALSGNSQGKKD